MPRGSNPNSKANLRPLSKGLPNKAQREIQLKGSKAGNKAKQEYKDLRDSLKEQLTPERSDKIMDMLLKKIDEGNLKALEIALKMMGSDESKIRDRLYEAQIERYKREAEAAEQDKTESITIVIEGAEDYAD